MNFHRNPVNLLTTMPSHVLLNGLFSVEECDKIIQDVKNKIKPETGSLFGSTENKEIRDSSIRWIHPSNEFLWIFNRIDYAINNVNNEWYNFDLLGYSQIQYTEYDESSEQHYSWHTDAAWFRSDVPNPPDQSLRKLSLSILLTQQETQFEGGNFELDNRGEPNVPLLDTGDAIFFPSFVWHQVKPVTKGVRCSLVVWVIGPKFR